MRREMHRMLNFQAALNALVQEADDVKEYVLVPDRRQPLRAWLNFDLSPAIIVNQRFHTRLLLQAEEGKFHERAVILERHTDKAIEKKVNLLFGHDSVRDVPNHERDPMSAMFRSVDAP